MRSDIQSLISLASRGLIPMFDAEKQLFCYRLISTKHGLVREGFSPRYTIMTLLGLRELELAGGCPPIDTKSVYESLVQDIRWITCAGDLGLLIWLMAAFAPDQFEGLMRRVDIETALSSYPDAHHGRTMELAWFLAGLAHAGEVSARCISGLTDLAVETYHRLEENQGEHGFFMHMHPRKSLAGYLRGHIGSFADQVYPVYAMAKFAKTFHVGEPLDRALDCTMAICDAQGGMGQWWWLYDASNGRVYSRYPVYSVHQHGMAPMSLFAVEEATGRSFRHYIWKGLRWIYGNNELGADVRDCVQNLIWRCILPTHKLTKYWETVLNTVRLPRENAKVGTLEILREDRPYELGWLLYAFARFAADEPNSSLA